MPGIRTYCCLLASAAALTVFIKAARLCYLLAVRSIGRRKAAISPLRDFPVETAPGEIKVQPGTVSTDAFLAQFPVFNSADPIIGSVHKSGYISHNDLAILAQARGHLVLPNTGTRHAHITVQSGVEYANVTFPLRLGTRCISSKATVLDNITLHSLHFSKSLGATAPPIKTCIISGKTFLESQELVTCTDNLDTIPKCHLDTIAAKLATDGSDPARIYDCALAFLKSKCLSEKIVVKDLALWCIYLCERVNKCSIEISPSIRPNLPVNATIVQRIGYYLGRTSAQAKSYSSYPKWDFKDVFVPSYTVHTQVAKCEIRDPIRPEPRTPFQDVRPTVDASADTECERSARTDGPECDLIPGVESSGTATDPAPVADWEDSIDKELANLDYRPTLPTLLSDETDSGPLDFGLGCRPVSPTTESGSTTHSVLVSSDESTGLAEMFGDYQVYILRNPYAPGGWAGTFEGGQTPIEVPLYGCIPCVREAGRRAVDGRQSIARHLGQFAGRFQGCAANAQGICQFEPCSTFGSTLPRSDKVAAAQAEAVRQVGQEVPAKEAARPGKGQKGRGRQGPARKSGRSRQMFLEGRDQY